VAKRDTRLFRRPGSPYWYARVARGDGRYVKRSLGTASYDEARRRLRELEADVGRAAPDRAADVVEEVTVAGMLVECEAWHEERVRARRAHLERRGPASRSSRAPGCSEATLEIFTKKARHLVRLLGEVGLLALRRAHVDEYIDIRRGEGAAAHTIAKELIELRKMLKLARSRGQPIAAVSDIVPSFDAGYEPRTTTLTPQQVEALLDHLPEHRRLWVVVAVWLGARLSGVEGLNWDDVDLAQGLVTLREAKTPGSHRTIPIPRRALEELERVPVAERAGKVVARWVQVQRDLARAAARARIPRVSPNDLRRTFGSWLYNEAGVDADKVGHLMGHADGRMVRKVYGRISRETERKMMDLLPD
jgi:integrase